MKRGTEDLDFFIGDEALAAANGPGVYRHGYLLEFTDGLRIWHTLSYPSRTGRELGRENLNSIRQPGD